MGDQYPPASAEDSERITLLYQGMRRLIQAHTDSLPTERAEAIIVEAIGTLFAREMVDQMIRARNAVPSVDLMMRIWRGADGPMRHSFDYVLQEIAIEAAEAQRAPQ